MLGIQFCSLATRTLLVSKLIIINLKEDDLRLCHRLETTSHFHWTQVTSLSIKVDVVVYVPGEGIRKLIRKVVL